MTHLSAKIYFLPSNLIRRFQLNAEQSYEEFDRTVREAFGVFNNNQTATYNWQYQDEENDWVSFSTEREWKDALSFHQQSGSKLFRLRLTQVVQRPEPIFRRPHHPHHHHHHQHGVPRHFGITCDGCNQHPIVGDRFKCTECDDFDFCSNCHNNEQVRNAHGHSFNKIEKPVRRCGRWATPQVQRHWGVRCDGCNQSGIIGDRYKCNDCEDFDFCANCHGSEEKRAQHGNHTFTKIMKPIPRGGRAFRDGEDVVFHWPIEPRAPVDEIKKVEAQLRQAFGGQVIGVEVTRDEPKPEKVEEPVVEKVEEETETVVEEEAKVEEPAPVVEEKPVEAPQIYPVAVEEPAPVVVEAPKVVERYPDHMHTLAEMGFENVALNRHLLNNYQGDITKVISSLLQLTGFRNH